jgi:hypothetical protein
VLPYETAAQDRKAVHYIAISGSTTDNTCHYQIEGQDDQNQFRIAPRGALIVTSSADFAVETTIEPDAAGTAGIAGDPRQNTFEVKAGSVTPIAVRRAMGKNTEHLVRIRCCTDRGFFGGCKWAPAEPLPAEPQQMGYAPQRLSPRSPEAFPAPHGPSAPAMLPDVRPDNAVPGSPTRTGGPVMKVEEDA